MVRRIISLFAIFCGILIHGRFLIQMIDGLNGMLGGIGLGALAIPWYVFSASLTFYCILGLFDLNKMKFGKSCVWAAASFSTLTLLIGWAYIPLSFYLISAIIFLALNSILLMKSKIDLNRITLTVSIILILMSFTVPSDY